MFQTAIKQPEPTFASGSMSGKELACPVWARTEPLFLIRIQRTEFWLRVELAAIHSGTSPCIACNA
jgi:hypothetical protein